MQMVSGKTSKLGDGTEFMVIREAFNIQNSIRTGVKVAISLFQFYTANMNASLRYLQYFVAVFIYVQLVNGLALAPRRDTSNIPSRTRPLKTSENVTELIEGDCPESDGFFPDPGQCDKYYECREGKIVAEKLCPDGMVFNAFSPLHEKCDLPFNIDCSQKPKLQEPKPTLHCPRLNGYFNHEDANTCNKFYYCVDGKFNLITCPDGLVYSEKTGICSWPDEAKKKGCSSQELFKFSCPKVDTTVAAQHPRYADPEDCQYFYVCINGEVPRRSGCKMGQVFNDETDSCDWPRNVPDCAEWYKGVLTEEELEALEHPTPKPKPKQPSQNAKRQKTKVTDFARILDTTQLPQ